MIASARGVMTRAVARSLVAGAVFVLACEDPVRPLTTVDVAGEYALRGKPTVHGYAVTTFESGTLALRLDGTMMLRDSVYYCYANSMGIQCSSFSTTSEGNWTLQGDSIRWGALPDLPERMKYVGGGVTRCYDLIETDDACDAQFRYDRVP